MKLKVGGRYLNGYGDEVTIVSHTHGLDYPYAGVWIDETVTYAEDGVFDKNRPGSGASLVREIQPGLSSYTAEGEGHYLGSIAVVVATSPEQAADLLSAAMAKEGVPQTVKPEQMKLLPTNEPKAVVLFNGDY